MKIQNAEFGVLMKGLLIEQWIDEQTTHSYTNRHCFDSIPWINCICVRSLRIISNSYASSQLAQRAFTPTHIFFSISFLVFFLFLYFIRFIYVQFIIDRTILFALHANERVFYNILNQSNRSNYYCSPMATIRNARRKSSDET